MTFMQGRVRFVLVAGVSYDFASILVVGSSGRSVFVYNGAEWICDPLTYTFRNSETVEDAMNQLIADGRMRPVPKGGDK